MNLHQALETKAKANANAKNFALAFSTMFFIFAGCAKSGSATSPSQTLPSTNPVPAQPVAGGTPTLPVPSVPNPSPATPLPTPAPAPSPAPVPTIVPHVVEFAPLWEAARGAEGRRWTLYTYDMLQTYGQSLIAGAGDMPNFCPSYQRLTDNQKINVWAYLISAVAKYESNFDPTSRYHESTMGNDGVTGQPVYSEGLLQLSYQDVQGYSFCNEFNWKLDQNLNPDDPSKTILDPFKNLKCGVRILNKIVARHGQIAFNSGHYWSTLQPKNQPEHNIEALVNRIPFCHL